MQQKTRSNIQNARWQLINAVHLGKIQLGLDEDSYNSIVQTITGKTHTTSLSPLELHQVLDALKSKEFQLKTPSQGYQSTKADKAADNYVATV